MSLIAMRTSMYANPAKAANWRMKRKGALEEVEVVIILEEDVVHAAQPERLHELPGKQEQETAGENKSAKRVDLHGRKAYLVCRRP